MPSAKAQRPEPSTQRPCPDTVTRSMQVSRFCRSARWIGARGFGLGVRARCPRPAPSTQRPAPRQAPSSPSSSARPGRDSVAPAPGSVLS